MASREMTLRLDPADLRSAIDTMLSGNPVVRMTAQYGETVTISRAAQILNHGRPTIYRMIEDGRLRTVDGSVVVQSIAEYLTDSRTADRRARLERRRGT